MMWMWMSSIVILLGAQLNNTLDTWNDQPRKADAADGDADARRGARSDSLKVERESWRPGPGVEPGLKTLHRLA